jgi:hypothetical protein
MSLAADIVNGFLSGMDWLINTLFPFVIPWLLKAFAFSILIMNVTKVGKRWIKWLIAGLYLAYIILKIAEIRNWVLYGNIKDFVAVVPFFCMLLLPQIAKNTEWGYYLLSYESMLVYYLIFNGIWLTIIPADGNLIYVFVYCLIMYFVGQFLQMFSDRSKPASGG